MSELNFTHSNGNKVKLTTPDTLSADKTFKLQESDGSVRTSFTDGRIGCIIIYITSTIKS